MINQSQTFVKIVKNTNILKKGPKMTYDTMKIHLITLIQLKIEIKDINNKCFSPMKQNLGK